MSDDLKEHAQGDRKTIKVDGVTYTATYTTALGNKKGAWEYTRIIDGIPCPSIYFTTGNDHWCSIAAVQRKVGPLDPNDQLITVNGLRFRSFCDCGIAVVNGRPHIFNHSFEDLDEFVFYTTHESARATLSPDFINVWKTGPNEFLVSNKVCACSPRGLYKYDGRWFEMHENNRFTLEEGKALSVVAVAEYFNLRVDALRPITQGGPDFIATAQPEWVRKLIVDWVM